MSCRARGLAPFAVAVIASVAATPPEAAPGPQLERLIEALAIDEMVEVLREEGLAYGADMGQQLFAEGDTGWGAEVARIHDPERMRAAMIRGLETGLLCADLETALAFFEEGPGGRLVRLEISARRAMLAPGVEEDALRRAARSMQEESDRFALADAFIEANDLIEANVAGTLNATLAFSQGLLEGGAFGGMVSEAQILADVAAQETQIRNHATQWLHAFLHLAHGPASTEDLEAYVRFSSAPAGRALNRALFEAHGALLTSISRELGLSAARHMAGRET